MVRATVLTVGDHAGEGVPTNKAKGEKMVLEPPMNSAQRRKLGDITNLQNQENLMKHGGKQQQQDVLVYSKENADYCQKENMKLMKVVMERDGIKSELQKVRIDFQKVQEQNLILAQANTRILAEVNTSKDQLKVLQHELGCKNGLVIARKVLLKEQTLPCTRHASKVKARANACGGDCKNLQDHENASESSNVNALQINEKCNNKRRVSGRMNPASSEVLDTIGRPGETCQKKDNIDKKKLVSDGDNAADKEEFVFDAENHINDNVQSKRYCAGRQSARFKIREITQTEHLQKMVDAKETKEDASMFSLTKHPACLKSQESEPSESLYESRFPLRRRSARLKSEPPESFHESIETTRTRSSAIFNIQELGVIPNLNGIHDDQDIAANAGCSASERSIGSKPEAGKPHETKEITRKSRVSLRRQSARFDFHELDVPESLIGLHDDDQAITAADTECSAGSKSEGVEPHDTNETTRKSRVSSRRQFGAIKESADPPLHDDIVEESSQVSSVSVELKREPTSHESEEMRKTSAGRPLRQAAGKIKSYKEVSLKEKMRRSL